MFQRRVSKHRHGALYLVVLPDSNALQFACAIGSFLEMYGFIEVEFCRAKDLPKALVCNRRIVTFICQQADWSKVELHFEDIRASAACVYLEGPVSRSLASRLGIRTVGLSEVAAALEIADENIRSRVTTLLEGYLPTQEILLEPISILADIAAGDGARNQIAAHEKCFQLNEAFESQSPMSTTILCVPGRSEYSVLSKSHNVLVSSFPFLNLICQRLSSAPTGSPVSKIGGERMSEALDYSIIFALAQAVRENQSALITLEPWPWGVGQVLSLRFDVDRPPTHDQWERLLTWHQRERIVSSWYFLAKTADNLRIRDLVSAKHEVSLHYTNLASDGEAALRRLQDATNAPACGATCHGGNFYGASDLAWLAKKKFVYGENIARCALFPYRPILETKRGIEALPIFVTARHVSVDKSLTPPVADFSFGERTKNARIRCGAHSIIMNHPDINFDALAKAFAMYRTTGTEVWTVANAIEWWAAARSGTKVLATQLNPTKQSITMEHNGLRSRALRIWRALENADCVEDERFGERHSLFEVPLGTSELFLT